MPQYIEQLETPAAVVDLDVLAGNLDRMAAYAALHSLQLRPHVKTHKAPRIAAEQLRLGAVGLTCATVREAEVMSELSSDLLVAYPVIGTIKLRRLMAVAERARVTVSIDSTRTAVQLAAAADEVGREVGVLVELDLGMRRVGVQTVEEAVELARFVADRAPLRYEGVAFYPGHIRQAIGAQSGALTELGARLGERLDALDAAGLSPRVVSGGSTPAAWRMHEVPRLTEVRPGTYVYNDRTTASVGACEWDECALTVLATVVSTAVPGQAVVDAGAKALGREPLDHARGSASPGFAALLDRPEVVVTRMSEEHGILDLSQTDWRPKVGDTVRLVPNHVCIVVHVNDLIYGVRNGIVETRWPVAARGRDVPEMIPSW